MAFFGVTQEVIDSVKPIDGADRIEVAKLRGKDFQFVIGKGTFAPGDACLYIPIDALLPQPLAEKLGVAGKLAGKDKNRVKTVKLRGVLSQGIVAPCSIASGSDPAAITAELGVTKYDPPEVPCHGGTLARLPEGQGVYDLEGADRYTEILERMLDQDVWVTEKVEGQNFSVTIEPDGSVFVNQRCFTILPIEGAEHTLWKIAREKRVIEFAQWVQKDVRAKTLPPDRITVYGEAIGPGIQGNVYKLAKHAVKLFDIRVGAAWVGPEAFAELMSGFFRADAMDMGVPSLYVGPLRLWIGDKTLKQSSDGRSKLADVAREGIVIKPLVEQTVENFGRLVLKQRSPEYLAKSEF